MDKRSLTERDICTKFILPAIKRAGWDEMVQVREEVYFTKGRIIVRGKLVTRGKAKWADYILYYKPNIPIAIIEAKDNNCSVGDGIQQALFRFSVKWRGSVPPLASVPPLRGGDFQGMRVYRSDVCLGRARKANFRAPHRLDEPTKLSLGMVASLQSPLPFHLAKSL